MKKSKEMLMSLISKTAGKSLWGFNISDSTGSIVSFECGDKVDRQKEVNLETDYEGEYSFMIYCSWRIMYSNKIITSWKDDTDVLKKGINFLENLKILEIKMTDSFDITICLENGLAFEVFCDQGESSDFDCNWFFREGGTYYSLNKHIEIEIE